MLRLANTMICLGLLTGIGRAASTALVDERAGRGRQPQYRVTHWTAENGLPQNSVKALLQTRDGYLWIGTLAGLARFDGMKFTVFDHGNTPQMLSDAINDLAEDELDGSVWIATGNGLLHYAGHRFERCPPDQGVAEVGQVWPAREGGVWFPPRRGQLGLMRGSRLQSWELAPDADWNDVQQMSEDGSTGLLVLLRGRFRRFDPNSNATTPLELPGVRLGLGCNSFLEEPDGSLWLCSTEGIWKGKGHDWNPVTHVVAGGPWPERIVRGGDGQLWVTQRESDRSSLQRFENGRLEPFVSPEFPPDLNATRLLEDREGNLWVGSTRGLFQLRPRHLEVFAMADGLRSDDACSVVCSPDDTVWVGTGSGFNGIRQGRVFPVAFSGDDGRVWPYVALADSAGWLWCGDGHRSLAGIRNEERTRLIAPPGQSWLNPSALYEDRQHRLWIGTDSGVACKTRDEWTCYATTNDPVHTSVRVIHQDRHGDMWFGLYGGGLNRLREGQLTAYRTALGEYNNRAWWIHEDLDGVFWVGTQNGLNRFVPPESEHETGRYFTFTTAHGLRENVINNIQEDEFGFLWLSGLRGIYRLARQELNDVATGRRTEVEVLAVGEADGMLNSECNGGDFQPAGCKDRTGRIWFPTVKGVVSIDPKGMRRNTVPPPVVIEQVIADERAAFDYEPLVTSHIQVPTPRDRAMSVSPVRKADPLRFGPGQARVLELHYTANSFVAPERVRFKYRLAGYDADWHRDDRNRRVAFYTNLRPGNYTFEVAACNNHGVWSEHPAALTFSLAPHLWQTWPFYGLCGLAILGIAGGLQAHRLRVVRRILRLDHERAMEQERARIARDLHDDLGASLTGVALQLEAAQRNGGAEGQQLAALAGETRSLAHELRELAWTTNPRCDNTGSLVAFIGEQTERFCQAADLACRLTLPGAQGSRAVPARVRHELLVVLKESFANIAAHACARSVAVTLAVSEREAQLTIHDDGRGFDPARPAAGSGLGNLRERAQQLGGSFTVASQPGQGTTVTARLPLHHANYS